MSYLVIRRLNIQRKIYWLLKITYIECLMNIYTTHILWSELWIVTSKNKNLLQNVLFWMVQFVTNFFVQSLITFWTFQSSVLLQGIQRPWDVGTKVWLTPFNLICCGTEAVGPPNRTLWASQHILFGNFECSHHSNI